MKQYYHSWLISFFLFSCTSPKEKEIEITNNYTFEVIDSLDLKFLGNPILVEVSPKSSRFAFYDNASKEFLFTDSSGEVLSKFSKNADTPDAHGPLMELPGFVDEENVALVGLNGVFLYDLAGNLVKKLAHPEKQRAATSKYFIGKGVETFIMDGHQYLLSKSFRKRDTYAGEQKFYDTFKALELIHLENEDFFEIVPFEEGSQFLDGNGYFASDYEPAYEVFEDKLYIALGGEKRLLVYSLHPNGASLDTIVHLQIPGFEKLPITSREEFYKNSATIKWSTPAIRNIHVSDGHIILHYYGGFPEAVMKEIDALWIAGNIDESNRIHKKEAKKITHGSLVLDIQTLETKGNVQFPEGVNNSGFGSGGGYLWMQRSANEEEEEDFLRIYKFKLVKK
ncbi:hypothetical protein MM213_05565 [Belliella sp. R4-6]|uniref:6-bladed beta-propeller protein n=1 Tax=Belliella alkalica TaxID=1730871 RepID=A0ABS9V931_9BACT|nr:hypothetical protein [Belliella alkalica]MCH7412939.1 hypothetical protein [Belliella alkalica]